MKLEGKVKDAPGFTSAKNVMCAEVSRCTENNCRKVPKPRYCPGNGLSQR